MATKCAKGWCKRELRDYKRTCAKGSVRTKQNGAVDVIVCCPKGEWTGKVCKVGTVGVALHWKKGAKVGLAGYKVRRKARR